MPTPTHSKVVLGDQPALAIRLKNDGYWTVWLHVEADHDERDYGGVCLAVNRDRVAALGEACSVLDKLHDRLHHHLIHGTEAPTGPDV